MPEDIIEEVSELEEEKKEVLETEHDEANAFETDEADPEEVEEGTVLPEEEAEKETEEPEKSEIKKELEEKVDEEAEETEEDEDIVRGRELIDEAAKVKKEAEEQEIKEIEKIGEKEEYSSFTAEHTEEDIKFFHDVIPENLLPDSVTLPDGTELDFKGFMGADPEFAIATAAIANNIVQQMIENGVLISDKQLQSATRSFDDKLFIRTLTNKADGVPKALEIHKGDAFKGWFEDQSDEIKALMDSSDPYDHVKVFKRFLGQAGKDKAGKKVEEIDGKREKAKKEFDAIHKTTVKNKGSAKKESIVSPEDEERAGFDEKDDDDGFYS